MNENPHDKDCSPQSECCTFLLTDLPILVLSIAVLWNQPTCKDRSNFASLLWACHVNGWVSVLISLHHMSISKNCCLNGAAIHCIVAIVAILVSQCTIVL